MALFFTSQPFDQFLGLAHVELVLLSHLSMPHPGIGAVTAQQRARMPFAQAELALNLFFPILVCFIFVSVAFDQRLFDRFRQVATSAGYW
jgi:hypothetical protein